MARRYTLPRRDLLLKGASAAVTLSLGSRAEASPELMVIVHRDNPQRLSTSEIEAIFRTTLRHWAGGGIIVALNAAAGAPERVSFDRAALRLEPAGVSRYWIDRKIRGGQPPPRAVSNPLLVARLVGELRTGIGYVPANLVHGGLRVVARVRGQALEEAQTWPRAAEQA